MPKYIKILLLSLCLIAADRLFAQETPMTLSTPQGEIFGTLLSVDTLQRQPVALIIAGSGPTDRNGNQPQMSNNALKMLAEALHAQGIASLRYDKRLIAASKMNGQKEEELLFTDYVNDAKEWVDLLAADTRFSKVYVIGHSEGSLIGLLAAEGNAKVAGVVSVAGIGRPAFDLLKDQLADQPQQVKSMIFPIIDSLAAGKLVAEVPPGLEMLFRPSVQPYLISWFKYNPSEVIRRVKAPVLIVQGDKDIQVGVAEANLLLMSSPLSKMVLIPGMTHVLKGSDTMDKQQQVTSVYLNPKLPISPKLPQAIGEFIKTTE